MTTRPCPYCWNPPEPEESSFSFDELPEPEDGFDPIHPDCEENMRRYIEQRQEEEAL